MTDFILRMQALLDAIVQAQTPEAKDQAREAMRTFLVESQRDRRRPVRDHAKAAAGDRDE